MVVISCGPTWYIEDVRIQGLAPVHIHQLSGDEGSRRGQQEADQRGDLETEAHICTQKSRCSPPGAAPLPKETHPETQL